MTPANYNQLLEVTVNVAVGIRQAVADPELRKLVSQLRGEHGSDFSLIRGGCFGFAETLKKVIGGDLWVVGSFEEQSDDWAAQHALLMHGGTLYDATGAMTTSSALKRFGMNGWESKIGPVKGWDDLWYPEYDEFLGPPERKIIAGVLKRHLMP